MKECVWKMGSTKHGNHTLPDNCRRKGCNGVFIKSMPQCEEFMYERPNICMALLIYEEKHGPEMLRESEGIRGPASCIQGRNTKQPRQKRRAQEEEQAILRNP